MGQGALQTDTFGGGSRGADPPSLHTRVASAAETSSDDEPTFHKHCKAHVIFVKDISVFNDKPHCFLKRILLIMIKIQVALMKICNVCYN